MYCILIAGLPAAGKSFFGDYLSDKLHIPYISKDAVSELLSDVIDSQSSEETHKLANISMQMLYYCAEVQMKASLPFMLENNFGHTSKAGILYLLKKYGYKTITVLFDGNSEVIYERFLKKEQLDCSETPAVNAAPEETPSQTPDFEAFEQGIELKGFRSFDIGDEIIRVDCTDFSNVDYEQIYEQIKNFIDRSDTAE